MYSRVFHRSRLVSLFVLLPLALVGCNPTSTETTVDSISESSSEGADSEERATDETADEQISTEKGADKAQTKDRPKPIAPALAPGDYCYQFSDETKDLDAQITIDAMDRITGDFQGVIHNEQNSYYTSYRQKLDGTIDGRNLNLDVTTWIELDKQNTQETWKVTPQGLSTERDTLSLKDCAAVSAAFQTGGLDAKDLVEGANRVKTREVFFEAGERSTTVSDAVVSGDRDVYTLSAQADQKMTLSISALEENAAFDLVSPSGMILSRESMKETVYLPERGEYQIVVGGTRGNATYELEIAIE